MSTTLPSWREKSSFEKFLVASSILLSIVIIILAALQLLGTHPYAILIFEPLMGVLMLNQALQYRGYNKYLSRLSTGAAAFLFAVTVFIYLAR